MKLDQLTEGRYKERMENRKAEQKAFDSWFANINEYVLPLVLDDAADLTGNKHLEDEMKYLKRAAPEIFSILQKAFK
jgi:hypothetical protein